jgi:hypothetical protein
LSLTAADLACYSYRMDCMDNPQDAPYSPSSPEIGRQRTLLARKTISDGTNPPMVAEPSQDHYTWYELLFRPCSISLTGLYFSQNQAGFGPILAAVAPSIDLCPPTRRAPMSSSAIVPLPLYVRLQYQITLARSAGEGTASAPGVREGVRG